VGRHSIPDPEDSPGDDLPEEPPTQHFGRQEPEEPDYGPGYDEQDDDEPGYEQPGYDETDYDEPGYPGTDYPEADQDYAQPRRAGGAAPPPRSSGPQHTGEWEGGEWTGSHRAVATGRRGISLGVIAALVAVVVVVGAFILWRFFGDALSHRTDALAARCVEGELAVAVVADPSIADQVQKLADTYNQSAAPVADRCVKVGVKPADSDEVVNGFIGKWPAELGERPAVWIPASSVSEARLEAAAGAQTVSDSRSLVTSPVLLAIRPELKDALAQQNWGTLPGLQTDPTALDGLNLPGWGPLRLSLPLSGDSDASYLAAEAVAAASAPPGAPASAGTGVVNTLVGGQPRLADNKASTAMDALLSATDPATAPVHAVVTTEQQLFQRAASMPNAKNTVASWLPPGPTATADYPTVLLSGNWVSQEQVSAASEFARFMRKPEQLAELAKAGFRTEGGTPPKSDVTSFAPVSAPPAVGDAELCGRTVDVRRHRWQVRGEHRSAVRSAQRATALDGVDQRPELAGRVGRRRGVVHHPAVGLHRSDGELPTGPEQFDPGHHRRPAHRPVARRPGASTVHPRGLRSGAPDRRQCHRLRQRLRPSHLGGGRTGQRRQLPEPDQLGLARPHHRDLHVPRLVRRH
jgi:Bacterial extracellular solute-binding protein